jgi:hypothetical protein
MKWHAGSLHFFRVFFLGFLAAVLISSGAWAQTGTTSLRGVVTDPSGAAIVGASVVLNNAQQGLHRETTTGPSGEYELLALPPGTYGLNVQASGFRKFERNNLELLVNTPATSNVQLDVGTALQTVEVSGEAVTLNTTDASLGISFDEDRVKQLPIESRNVAELLSLQAGVAYTGNREGVIEQDNDSRNGSVNGARSDQSNITLDGVDVNSDTKGYAFKSVLPITADSVQEFRVTTSNYNADQGRSSGAQVALVTKSGTNSFHGSVYEYNRNAATSANDYLLKNAELQGGQPNKPEALVRNNFGASLGGPIIKNRFFFFLNYEGERQADQQSTVRTDPSAALRDGVITYPCDDPTACPGGTVQGLTAPHVIAPGNFALSPAQIKAMDPQGIGVSTLMTNYFNTFPLPNDNSIGDGINFQAYRFAGRTLTKNNWYIARADYNLTKSGNHTLFWRGALRNDSDGGVPYLPGQAPELSLVDYSKGFSVGYNAVLRPNLINNFRWGYTRQSFGEIGNQNQPYVQFRELNDQNFSNIADNGAFQYQTSLAYQVPVHNFVDDVSWIKGRHTLSFGGNINILRNPQSSTVNSFDFPIGNSSVFIPAGMGNQGVPAFFDPNCSQTATPVTGGCFDGKTSSPTEPHYPKVSAVFVTDYDYPMMALVGMINSVQANYNYTKGGATLAPGAPVTRHFAEDSYEMYAQDSWKIKPNLTLTYGLRYSLFSPPWETNGLQVVPNVNLSDWFAGRAQNALQGIGSNASPTISFNLGGPANHAPGLYNWDYKDLAPRLSVAYSPGATEGFWKSLFGGPGKTTIRAGAGMVYDRLGPALLATFDQSGSFGLSSSISTSAGAVTPTTAPRITSLNEVPTQGTDGTPLLLPAPVSTFPQTYPFNTFSTNVYFSTDQSLKTPYAYTFDLSVGRDLGHNFTFEVAYVGRLAHRLLAQEDVAAPEDIVDPKTHIDYYAAATALAKLYRQGTDVSLITPQSVGPTAQYWANILQPLQPGGAYSLGNYCGGTGSTKIPVQAAYALLQCFSQNETTALQALDQGGIPDFNLPGVSYFGPGGPGAFIDPQFISLFAWRSIGTSSYHALQVNLRSHTAHSLQFDFNYTYSKSLDLSSGANRVPNEQASSLIINPWDPTATKAVSDFDTTHQFNANWIWGLPFGKGRWIGRDSHGALDALIGGWQLSGLLRWTSGFPVSVGNGGQWPTNWQISGNATQLGPVATHGAVKTAAGTVNIFGDAAATAAALSNFQADFPGQVGSRNTLRGDGYAGFDAGLDKRWKMPWKESHSLQLRWEVFNVFNLTRFDPNTISLSLTNASSFGNYTALFTTPRTMQFALRYEF